jgi:hypothetical protein
MTTHNVDDVATAYLQTHNAFQELTFLLERKGIITLQELAAIYGESEPVFRAESVSECATDDDSCSHIAHTDSETLANKGMQSRDLDNRTSARDSAVVRVPMGKAQAAGAYSRALQALEPLHSWHFWGIQEYVRCIRAEAASWRTKAHTAGREIALLKIQLEEATRERA